MAASTEKAVKGARGQGRQAIIDAARQVFEEKGYGGASTREIAERAGFSEVLLFRYFGTKAALFEQAVLDPFAEFLASWIPKVELDGGEVPELESLMRAFVARLYQLSLENRGLILSLIAAARFDPEVIAGHRGVGAVTQNFEVLGQMIDEGMRRLDLGGVNIPVSMRAVVGMVMAMAVLDDLLMPFPKRPKREAVIDEITEMVLHGVLHRRP